MHDDVTRVESGSELPQRELLCRALQPFEEDYGAAAVRDLGKLQFADMLPERCQRAAIRAIACPLSHRQKLTSVNPANNRKLLSN